MWRDNAKVAENYVFMTLLQVLNICFYLVIYPYLIRVVGAESYGLYAYAEALVAIFVTFVSFGFDLPATKQIAEEADSHTAKEQILSEVTMAKLVLEMVAILVFAILLLLSPIMRAHKLLFGIAFLQTIGNIFFPQWYFQGVQRMRAVTYVQAGCKLLSLPFIFLCIHSPEDTWLYMLIVTLTNLLGATIAWLIIRYRDGLHMRLVCVSQLKAVLRKSLPFFLSNAGSIIKEQGLVLIIGRYLGMEDVAIYDLANKIIIIPRTIFSKLNDAIYPKMMTQMNVNLRRKIVWGEVLLGVVTILAVAALGYWVVLLLGGRAMIAAYPISVILSVTVLTWLVAGALICFYIIPSGKTYYITVNQIIAMLVTFLIAGIGLYYTHNVYVLASSLAIAGLIEIAFCTHVVFKNQMR
ncbi:MAG: oligosaccharide flippase family protein [Paludibacteraceae bacterium]|nr:oligosaccharide flippase family protein [Paludibacteraceae bacterium]